MSDKYWQELPKNDEEVNEWIDNLYESNIGETLKAIYRVQRKKGNSVFDSWENTLKAHLEIIRKGS